MTKQRVCVPNDQLGYSGDWQERGARSAVITEVVVSSRREQCQSSLVGEEITCPLEYSDITAVASELEEIGYVNCDNNFPLCQRFVTETAVQIDLALRGTQE